MKYNLLLDVQQILCNITLLQNYRYPNIVKYKSMFSIHILVHVGMHCFPKCCTRYVAHPNLTNIEMSVNCNL
jgi:hypothetical protein